MEKLTPMIHAVRDAGSDDEYRKSVTSLAGVLTSALRYEVAKLIGEHTLKLLKTEKGEVRLTWVCFLIHSLSYGCEKAKTLLGKDLGAIPPLLKVLNLPPTATAAIHQAAAALASLVSGVQKCRTVFQSSEGVATTAHIVKEIGNTETAKVELLLLLSAVARSGTMGKQIIDQKLFPMLVQLSTDSNVKLSSAASSVLAGLSSHSPLVPFLTENNILQICQDILKKFPLSDTDEKAPIADHVLEIIGNLSQEPGLDSQIDSSFAILVARRCRQLGSRDQTKLTKTEKAFYQVLINSSHVFRQNELYRIKMETADPDSMLGAKPAPVKTSTAITKLIAALSDTDESKSTDAARQLVELMQKSTPDVRKEILIQDDVFAKLWKFVRTGRLGWDDKWFITIDQSKLKFKEELGTGAFSTVYRGTLKVKGKKEPVAIKALDETIIDLPDLRCEMATLSMLSGVVENMVQMNGYFYLSQKNTGVMKVTKKYHCIVMELMETNLEEILHDLKKKQNLTPQDVRQIAFDIAVGMSQLHSFTVLHRDLKPANILLTKKKDGWIVKLADFGYARRDSKESLRKSVVGTPAYLAPELVGHTKSDDVGMPADVYSYGVILWEMITRKKPHDGMESASLFHHVITSVENRTPIFNAPPDSDPAISELVKECTHADPRRRPAFDEIQLRFRKLFAATKA